MSLTIKRLSSDNVNDLLESYLRRYHLQSKSCHSLASSIGSDKARSNIDYLCANCPGVVAYENGDLIGCLTGYLIDGFKMDARGVYCPEIANFAEGSMPLRTFKLLYKAACDIWQEEKVACQAIAAFSYDAPFREALTLNEFGIHVMDCIRWSTQIGAARLNGYTIRRASAEDIDDYLRLNDALFDHICTPPISQYYPQRRPKEVMLERLIDQVRHVWLAKHEGKAIGFLQFDLPVEDVCYSVRYNDTAGMSGAYVDPEHRSTGITELLLETALEQCRANGVERASVDFESANAQAHGFWTRYFEPVVYSYLRRLDARSIG